jgi:hypothetical protein
MLATFGAHKTEPCSCSALVTLRVVSKAHNRSHVNACPTWIWSGVKLHPRASSRSRDCYHEYAKSAWCVMRPICATLQVFLPAEAATALAAPAAAMHVLSTELLIYRRTIDQVPSIVSSVLLGLLVAAPINLRNFAATSTEHRFEVLLVMLSQQHRIRQRNAVPQVCRSSACIAGCGFGFELALEACF